MGIIKKLEKRFGGEIRLYLDNCPQAFEFNKTGYSTIEEIDRGFKYTKETNKIKIDNGD